MPRIEDIARAARVSKSTVSRVLAGHPHVRPATRERVLAVIADLHYRPSALAQGLSRGQQRLFAAIVPDIGNEFFASLARGIEEVARAHGYGLIIMNTDESPARQEDCLQAAAATRVAGIALVPCEPAGRLARLLPDLGVPVVVVGREPHRLVADAVVFHNEQGAYLATSHLLHIGHRRIAYLGGPPSSQASAARTAGYLRALSEGGLPSPAGPMGSGDLHYASGQRFVEALLRERRSFTALFAANDLMAVGAMEALRRHGLKVPEDVSVVGFDDSFISSLPGISLTTVRQPPLEMGRQAARILLERVTGTEAPRRRVVYEPQLVVRATTAPPPPEP